VSLHFVCEYQLHYYNLKTNLNEYILMSINIEEMKSKCDETLSNLLDKYKDNDYMKQRIYNHIVNYLPNTLENELKNHEKRVMRNNFLTNEQQIFIQVFLSKNKYYYLPNNNFFYEYNNEKYLIVKEDDVLHKLLSTISNDRVLLQWKYKTKSNIIKQIKERSLFASIPETDTIQNVLNVLYPSFFYSKNAAKYFLTIIGDNILKKNNTNIFLVTQKMKSFLNELDNVSLSSIGISNATHNFMTKYHENHLYENCRLIKINENFSNEVWREMLKRIGLDLLCVAAHYSNRYENSDKFIENKSDEELKGYTYYLKNTTPNNIVSDFCNKYILESNADNKMEYKIEWKNLHFVWKLFLSSCNLPNVIFSNTLKNIIKERYLYDEEKDSFIGITSKYLPVYSDFILFWENVIITNGDNGDNMNNNSLFDNEFEMDELCSLFKYWSKQNATQLMSNGNISEENIVKILKHFFPSVEIIEDKFILNVTCTLWNKTDDIKKSFKYIKEVFQKNLNLALISLDDAYNYYYKFCNENALTFIVSKRFFEKYLYFTFNEHIVYEKFIEIEYFTCV
jgi:hypothetical protein